MKIGIDLDDVLNNLVDMWLRTYNKDFNKYLTPEDIKCWELHKYVDIGKDIYNYLNDDLFKILSPTRDSIKVTKKLSEDNELFIITATDMNIMSAKSEWLKKYFPHIDSNNIFTGYRKDLINVDILIDDAPHNINSFPNFSLVYDKPWNRNTITKTQNIARVESWNEIYDFIIDFKMHYKTIDFKKRYKL